MDSEQILNVIREHTARVLDVQSPTFGLQARLVDLGANSIDRMEIVTLTMETLGLKFPLVELGSTDNIQGLVEFFLRKHGDRR